TVVTDKDLNKLADGPVFAIHQHAEVMEKMDDWNTRQHGNSGLSERVRLSSVDYALAEQQTIDFLQNFVGKRKSPMCGNSICQDRRFMARLMPELEDYFHYRNLDVSTLKELSARWYPGLEKGLVKNSKHLALEDIYDSIEELKYYRSLMFRSPKKVARRVKKVLKNIDQKNIDHNNTDNG
ncbi:MAG: oligoribonuclease, partial [Gammaproteobacteria bacterium]|nr:oligoribonuclease [Gammaproteobacteria bacterium]